MHISRFSPYVCYEKAQELRFIPGSGKQFTDYCRETFIPLLVFSDVYMFFILDVKLSHHHTSQKTNNTQNQSNAGSCMRMFVSF